MSEHLLAAAAAHVMTAMSGRTDDPARALWNERLAEYLARQALHEANSSFGEYRHVLDRHELLIASLENRFGKGWRLNEEAKAEHRPSWDEVQAIDEQSTNEFLVPLWDAARALCLTPAPDIAAAMVKVDIMKREEMSNDTGFDRDAMDVVKEDFAALREAADMGIHASFKLTNRAEIEAEIERLIALLDAADGDCDLEDDDPAGDWLDERGEYQADNGTDLLPLLPVYGLDQTLGPLNERDAYLAWQDAQRLRAA